MPTVEELCRRLQVIAEEKTPNPLNQFARELVSQVQAFLTEEFHRLFPPIQVDLRSGESYRQRLRELGVPRDAIDGSAGMYIGNARSANIIIDLEVCRQQILQLNVGSAVINLCDILMEEFTHALFPNILDRDLATSRQQLTEKFLPGFKFTEDQKRDQIAAVSGEPKDGYFDPDFQNSTRAT